MIEPTVFVVVWIVTAVVGIVVLYFVIRAAVTHALRAHEAWMRDGSFTRYLERHAERLAAQAEAEAQARAALRRDRDR